MTQRTAVTKWVVGVLTAIVLGLSTWGLSAISNDRERIRAVEVKADIVDKRMERIENKIDQLLQQRSR